MNDEQTKVLTELADLMIAEKKEAAERNKQVDEHTAKLEKFNEQVAKLAEEAGVEDSFQVQAEFNELPDTQTQFEDFSKKVSDLAKEQGLEGFGVKRTE